MDAKPDPKELQEAIRLAGRAPCTCKGKAKSLFQAAENGCLKCSATFIRQAKMQKNAGQTALMKSAWNGHLEVTKLLIPLEAKMQDNDGATALMESAMNGHLEIAKLLVEHEAGIKTNDDRTATTIAISSYQPSCLRLLLANKAEREASQIPQIMLAAYHGYLQYLLSNKSEWSTIHNRMTVLDFALLGGQRRDVRLLAGSEEARRSFVEEFSSRFDKWNSIPFARRFLSANASSMLDIAPAVHMMNARCKSRLLLVSLIEQKDNVSHILRAVCTPDAGLILQTSIFDDEYDGVEFRVWYEYYNEEQVASVLAGLKHVGFSYNGKTAENLAKEQDGPVEQYLAFNPLKRAQTRRARKEAERKLPDEKQACWRETEAESAFNGSLVTGSRDAILSASRPPRRIPNHNSNRIQQKQVLNRRLLMSFVRSMQRIVQEMLDE